MGTPETHQSLAPSKTLPSGTRSSNGIPCVMNFIGGAWVESRGTDSFPVMNPSIGRQIASVPLSTSVDVDDAVRAAERRTHYMKCPKCGADLVREQRAGVEIEKCPECHGLWLDPSDAELLTRPGAREAASGLLTALARGMRISQATTAPHGPHKG